MLRTSKKMIDLNSLKLIKNSGLIDPLFLRAEANRKILLKDIHHEYLASKDLWRSTASPLFCGKFYLEKYSDINDYEAAPLLHFLKHGIFELRSPSPFIDMDYIQSQLIAKGINLLKNSKPSSKDPSISATLLRDILIQYRVNPNVFFDSEYFSQSYPELNDSDIPIETYLKLKGRHPSTGEYLETCREISLVEYTAEYPDVDRASNHLTPLEHILLWGLEEGRLGGNLAFIDKEFVAFYNDLDSISGKNIILQAVKNAILKKRILGPRWRSEYHSAPLPALAHKRANDSSPTSVFIGVVLYQNTEDELYKLTSSIKNERDNFNGIIEDYYFVNDTDNFEFYKKLIPENKLITSKSGNVGFGSAHNELMKIAFKKADLYFGLNPDGYLLHKSIETSVNFSDYHENEALIELASFPMEHPKWYDPTLLDTKWVSGAAFCLSKKIWKATGGFDPSIHMYCEDVDLSWRVKAAGFKLKVCPSAKFFHDVTPRFIQDESEDQSIQQLNMLKGAYYLADKWKSNETKDKILQIANQNNYSLKHFQELKPSQRIKSFEAAKQADFSHWLRFSPSRFWN